MAGMAKIRAPVLIQNRQNTNALRLADAARRQGRWIKATRHYARALLRRLAVEIEDRRPGAVLAGEEGSGTSPEDIEVELAPELDPDLAGAAERPASGTGSTCCKSAGRGGRTGGANCRCCAGSRRSGRR